MLTIVHKSVPDSSTRTYAWRWTNTANPRTTAITESAFDGISKIILITNSSPRFSTGSKSPWSDNLEHWGTETRPCSTFWAPESKFFYRSTWRFYPLPFHYWYNTQISIRMLRHSGFRAHWDWLTRWFRDYKSPIAAYSSGNAGICIKGLKEKFSLGPLTAESIALDDLKWLRQNIPKAGQQTDSIKTAKQQLDTVSDKIIFTKYLLIKNLGKSKSSPWENPT